MKALIATPNPNVTVCHQVLEPESVSRVYEEYAGVAGATEGPVAAALQGLVPATGTYYMASSWLKKVGS